MDLTYLYTFEKYPKQIDFNPARRTSIRKNLTATEKWYVIHWNVFNFTKPFGLNFSLCFQGTGPEVHQTLK